MVYTGGPNSADMGPQLGGTQFGQASGQDDDSIFSEAARQSTSTLAIHVTVRRKIGVTVGKPEAGIQDVFQYRNTLVLAYLWSVSPQDVYKGGGFYQYGDIVLGFEESAIRQLEQTIRTGQSENDVEGDRVLFNLDARSPSTPLEYRIVGNVDFNPIGATQVVRKVICRKIGTSAL